MSDQVFHVDPNHGEIVHQSYKLPWPLKTRELVMKCKHETFRSQHRLVATCQSVVSDKVPEREDRVRMEIVKSRWNFQALSNGKTRIATDIWVDEKFSAGVPGVLVKFVQSKALAESVTNFQKAVRQLDLGPHPDFVTWKMKATGRGSSKSSAAREGKQPLKQSTQRSDPYGLIEAVEATCSFFGYLCLIWFVGAVSRLAIRFAAWHSVLASSRRRILDTSLIVEHLRVLFF